MRPSHKRTIYLGAVGLVLIALIMGLVRFRNAPLAFAVQPLAKNAPILKTEDVDGLLSSNFRIVRRVQQVPSVVKQDFPSLHPDEPFAMVNPGQEMSTDMILRGVPNKRLVFAGVADSTVVVVFEQGGFAVIRSQRQFLSVTLSRGYDCTKRLPVVDSPRNVLPLVPKGISRRVLYMHRLPSWVGGDPFGSRN